MWTANPDNGVWLLPSRGRPEKLTKCVAAMVGTGISTPGLVILEERERQAYQDVALPAGWVYRFGQDESQGDKIRAVWPSLADYDWVGWLGDDQEPVTPHWDRRLIAALTGTNLVSCNDDWVIHGDDRHPPGRLAGCWVWSGPLLRAIGYWFPSHPLPMHHNCLDDVFEHLDGLEPFRTIIHDVTILHHHWQQKDPTLRVPQDDTGHRVEHFWGGRDEIFWQRWRDSEEPIYAADRIRKLKAELCQKG